MRGTCGKHDKDESNDSVYERCRMEDLCKGSEVWWSGMDENKYFEMVWLSLENEE